MKQIIINADDFGINEIVTSEIERLILAKHVSSTTVMANGACLDEVKCFAADHPEISFGAHLCLTEFDSITKSKQLKDAGITDQSGRFVTKAIFDIKAFDNLTIEAIRKELYAQIDIISALGFPISHADSHHHVHTIPQLKELFADVINKSGIRKVRLGGDFRTLRTKLHVQKWMRLRQLNRYYKKYFITTSDFYGFAEFIDAGQPIKDGETIELMCHPGHPGLKYQDEIQKMERVTLSKDIKLITYNELY